MSEHPVNQIIEWIEIDAIPDVQSSYGVGRNGVTRIEACTKSGMHADIPYVRVWRDETCVAEFCQHNIVGVYFAKATASTPTSEGGEA
jgi:hypothetical protein